MQGLGLKLILDVLTNFFLLTLLLPFFSSALFLTLLLPFFPPYSLSIQPSWKPQASCAPTDSAAICSRSSWWRCRWYPLWIGVWVVHCTVTVTWHIALSLILICSVTDNYLHRIRYLHICMVADTISTHQCYHYQNALYRFPILLHLCFHPFLT